MSAFTDKIKNKYGKTNLRAIIKQDIKYLRWHLNRISLSGFYYANSRVKFDDSDKNEYIRVIRLFCNKHGIKLDISYGDFCIKFSLE